VSSWQLSSGGYERKGDFSLTWSKITKGLEAGQDNAEY
jgi:hypothetical protein